METSATAHERVISFVILMAVCGLFDKAHSGVSHGLTPLCAEDSY